MADGTPDLSGFTTWIGSSTPDSITVGGRDLPSELMGRVSLTELAFLLVMHRDPTPAEQRMVDTVLVALADHGLTPSALSTRLTHTGAPEAVQASIAAGLLGAGSVFLGPTGDTADFLAAALAAAGPDPDLAAVADEAVAARRAEGRRVPGLGHPVHREVDPRTPRFYKIAEEEGVLGPHLRLLAEVARAQEEQSGRHLPINGAGAAGAALADVGLPVGIIRAFVLIGRTAGLVAHLAEEDQTPLGLPVWMAIEDAQP